MYLINYSFTISHEETVYVIRMKLVDPQWTSKAISVATEADEKSARPIEESCVRRTF